MSDVNAILESKSEPTLGDIPVELKELFNRDPLSLTSKDLMSVVLHLRAARQGFAQEEAESKNSGKRPNYKKAVKEATSKLDLSKVEI